MYQFHVYFFFFLNFNSFVILLLLVLQGGYYILCVYSFKTFPRNYEMSI